MTTYYVNGKRVAEEELSKYEITNENAKRVFLQAAMRIEAEREEKEEKGR